MIFDALSKVLWTAGTGCTVANDIDGQPAIPTITQTYASNAYDTLDGGNGTTKRLVVNIRYTGAQQASGSGVVTFVFQKSSDGTNWFDSVSGASDAITLTTSAQAGVVPLQFVTQARYWRLNTVISGSPTTGTITIQSADYELTTI